MAPHPIPKLDADDLAAVARGLVEERPPWPDPPLLVALPWGDPWRVDDLGADVEVLPIPADVDPLHVLCHQRRRPEWVALGLLVEGWAIDPTAPGVEVDWRGASRTGPPAEQVGRRVRALHLAGVDGAVAVAIRAGHDPIEVHAEADGGAPGGPSGALADGLRRALELPTPPCPVTALELWAAVWLEAVLAEPGGRGAGRGWRCVAALHPGATAVLGLDPHLDVDPSRDLVPLGRAHARAFSWDRLQLAAATGDGGGWLPRPDVAAWADAGMFARLVLGTTTPLATARRRLDGRLHPATLGKIDAALAAWGVGGG